MKKNYLACRGLATLRNARLALFMLGALQFMAAHAEDRSHQSQESKIFVYGVATNSCGKLVEDLKQTNGWVGYSSWLNGYLTGVNVYNSHAPRRDGRRDIRREHDPQSLVLWIEKFCRENPLSTVMDATLMLVIDLERSDR